MARIIVDAKIPPEATEEEVAIFVAEALMTWGGQRHMSDPLFCSLEVLRVRTKSHTLKVK